MTKRCIFMFARLKIISYSLIFIIILLANHASISKQENKDNLGCEEKWKKIPVLLIYVGARGWSDNLEISITYPKGTVSTKMTTEEGYLKLLEDLKAAPKLGTLYFCVKSSDKNFTYYFTEETTPYNIAKEDIPFYFLVLEKENGCTLKRGIRFTSHFLWSEHSKLPTVYLECPQRKYQKSFYKLDSERLDSYFQSLNAALERISKSNEVLVITKSNIHDDEIGAFKIFESYEEFLELILRSN